MEVVSSYFEDRTHRLRCGDSLSDPVEVTCGAPQGGVLAPLAFIIYINDLLLEMNDQHVLSIGYADDTCFLVNFASEIDRGAIEKLLVRVQRWPIRNGLLLNARKCCYVIFGNQLDKPMTTVMVHSDDAHDETCSWPEVSCVSETKYLGLILDDWMIWRAHVDHLIKKLRTAVACISKLGRAAAKKVTLQAYRTLLESHLRYGILSYGSAFRSVLAPIEKIQNSCIRIIPRRSRFTAAEPLFDELGILPFRELYLSVLLSQLHTRQPHIALNLEIDNAANHAYGTREQSAGYLRPPASRLERTKKLFTRQYLSLYNFLPDCLKSWKQIKILKRKKNIEIYIRGITVEDVDFLLS